MSDIIIVLIVVGLPVVCGTFIALTAMKHKQSLKAGRYRSDEEAEIIEEIYQGLVGLRKRIENLETILGDRSQK